MGVRPAGSHRRAANVVVRPAVVRHGRHHGREADRALRRGLPKRGDKDDASFDPVDEDLLATVLRAASLDKRPIADVFRWAAGRPRQPRDGVRAPPQRVLPDRGRRRESVPPVPEAARWRLRHCPDLNGLLEEQPHRPVRDPARWQHVRRSSPAVRPRVRDRAGASLAQ